MTGLPCSTVIDEDLTLARIKVSPTSRDGIAHLRSRSGSTVAGGNWMLARITVSPTSRDGRAHLRSRSGSTVAGGNWMLARITASRTSRDGTSSPTNAAIQTAHRPMCQDPKDGPATPRPATRNSPLCRPVAPSRVADVDSLLVMNRATEDRQMQQSRLSLRAVQ